MLSKKISSINKNKKYLLYSILAIGFIIIIREYIGGRSLWVDEAMLALNMNKSFGELSGILDNHQTAPILFLFISKILVLIFGISDYTVRLLPLLAGLGSLFVFYLISKKLFDIKGSIIAIALYISTDRLIYYANEFKQYSVDVFVSLIFIYLLIGIFEDGINGKNNLLILFTGMICIWLSYTSIIILFVFIIFLYFKFILIKNKKMIISTTIIGSIWLANILLLYFFVFKQNPDYQYQPLIEYWSGYFMPFPFQGYSDIIWLPKAIKDFFVYFTNSNFLFIREYPIIKDILAYIFMALFVFGIYLIFKSKKRYLSAYIILILTIAIIVSAFNVFPFGDRMVLYIVPLMLIMCTHGIAGIISRRKKAKIIPVILLIIIFVLPFISRIYHLIEPTNKSEIKAVISYFENNKQAGDKIFIKNHEVYYLPQYTFYSDTGYDFTDLYDDFKTVKDPETLMNEMIGNERVWAIGDIGPARDWFPVLDHYMPETLASRYPFNLLRNKITYLNNPNAKIYLYDCSHTHQEYLIIRFYKFCLSREPDEAELNQMAAGISEGSTNINDLIDYFYYDEDFINKKYDDRDFIKISYMILLNREPDGGGSEYWSKSLEEGLSRREFLDQIIDSPEFKNMSEKSYRF